MGGLKNNVKLFGSTINTMCDPLYKSHIQSCVFSMNKTTLEYLIKCEIFSMTNYAKTFEEAIFNKEVQMSRRIIENNWNIGSLLKCHKDVDFRFKHKKPLEYNNRYLFIGDMMFYKYMNNIWNIYDVIFIKGNRGIKTKFIC